jgi:diguanylate cyclase (GGDEF)-like protein/PAS domain S-box-containing protein
MYNETNPISLDLLLSNLPGMAYRCRIDADWTMEFVSAGAFDLTGYQASDLVGNQTRSYAGLIHLEDRDRIWQEVQRDLAHQRTIQVTYRIITASDEQKWVWEKAKVIHDENGTVTALEGFITDVTATKEAEEKIRESEERFRNVANVVTDAVWEWDMASDKVWYNSGLQTLLGLAALPSSPDSNFWSTRVHPEDQDRILRERDRAIQSGERLWHSEYRLRRADGSYAYVLDKIIITRNVQGRPIRMAGGIVDLSERKRQEAEDRRQLAAQSDIVELLRQIAVSDLELPTIIDLVAKRAQSLTGATGSAVELFDKNAMIYCATSGSTAEQIGMQLGLEDSLSGIAFERAEQIYCEDTETDPRVNQDACRKVNARSMIIAPLRAGAAIMGVLKVLSDRTHAFSTRDRSNLEVVVEALGTVIQRHTALDQLKNSEAQYRLLFNNNPHPMWVYDAASLHILAVNHAAIRKYGYSEQEFLGMSMHALYASGDPKAIESSLKNALRGYLPPALSRHRQKDDSIIDVELSGDAITFNHAPALLSLASDVTQRLRAERGLAQASERLHHLALYDPLTQLPNRLLFLDRLQHALAALAARAASASEHAWGALLYLDLDNFKAINDTFGREAGDVLIQQVAARLKACVDTGATVARLGADEFAVMLENLDLQATEAARLAEAAAERMLAAISAPYRIAGHEYFSTGCVGITLFDNPEDKPGDLLKQADLAMHRAKEAGRNALQFFDQAMQAAVMARSELEAQLRHALKAQQFHLHYQAQLDCKGRVTGAEALARWHHPQRGIVLPGDFIPLAEDTGMILQLGYALLQRACEQLAAWSQHSEAAPLSVAVNISARQFRHASFVQQVKDIVTRSGADPRKLRLELTESMLVENIEDTIEKMHSLREYGVRFSLDDFGTGYSSLLYLKRLPLESLKIDRSFVRDILTDPNDAAIVRTIISLGESLGLGILAEGVEQETQRDCLEQLGCGHYQGYLFSHPLPAKEFEAYLLQRQAGSA